MKVSEQIAIMKAYEDGKTIERRALFTSEWKSIDNINNYQFNFAEYEYRIKQVPKYRPYESVDEAFNEAEKHGFWVKSKDKNSRICYDPIEKDNCSYGALKRRKSKNKEKYKDVILKDCVIQPQPQS